MTCAWCDEEVVISNIQNWTLIADSELEDMKEEYVFCCYTCLMRWVNL
jgi:hypothetical protein